VWMPCRGVVFGLGLLASGVCVVAKCVASEFVIACVVVRCAWPVSVRAGVCS
jgi:hypothetical protein